MNLEAWTPLQRRYFGKNHDFFKFDLMEPVAMAPYSFFVSQRPTVIRSGNEIHARADQTNSRDFQNTSFTATKTMVKVRKCMDCTTTFRRTIAPVDDITLRV